MAQTILVGSLNFNGSSSPLKIKLLNTFLTKNSIDIMFLQEIKSDDFSLVYNYNSYTNIGSESLGTAILTRKGIELHSIEKLPSGRGISGVYEEYTLVNLYAPSGTNKRQLRNVFYSEELPYLIRSLPQKLILGGDYNCVLRPEDTTSKFLPSECLQQLITKLNLCDAWTLIHKKAQYTYFSGQSASRLDRFYISHFLKTQVQSIEVVPAPFSDHSAIVLHILINTYIPPIGRSYWKLNVSCLRDSELRENFHHQWQVWLQRRDKYHDIADWWDLYAKPKIRSFFKQHSYQKYEEEEKLINFYYKCLREYHDDYFPTPERRAAMSRCKAKIQGIYRRRMEGLKVRSRESNSTNEERANLYFLTKIARRRKTNTITKLEVDGGQTVSTQYEISKTIREYYTDIFS